MASRTLVAGDGVRIDGLKESIAGLRRQDTDLPKVVARVSREIAKDPVAKVARQKWAKQRIKPTVANRVIKWSGTTRGAAVKLRYGAYPYAAGVEFGSWQFRQFPRWTGNQFAISGSTGLIVQAAIRETLPQVEQRWLREVIDAILEATRRG